MHILGMDDGHAAGIGKFPEIFRAAANADLDAAFRVQYARQHRLAKRGAVVEFRPFVNAARVAMGVNMDHAHRPAPFGKALHDRTRDRMIAPTDRGIARVRATVR
jgi:hypothetical protein